MSQRARSPSESTWSGRSVFFHFGMVQDIFFRWLRSGDTYFWMVPISNMFCGLHIHNYLCMIPVWCKVNHMFVWWLKSGLVADIWVVIEKKSVSETSGWMVVGWMVEEWLTLLYGLVVDICSDARKTWEVVFSWWVQLIDPGFRKPWAGWSNP